VAESAALRELDRRSCAVRQAVASGIKADVERAVDAIVSSSSTSRGSVRWRSSAVTPRPITDALTDVPAEPAWIVRGYVAPSTVTLLAGKPKVGKSTFVFGLIAAVSQGREFLGAPTRQTGVLLLTEEREPTLKEKVDGFRLDERVYVLMRYEEHLPWRERVAESVAFCKQHGIGLIVVDVLDKWVALAGDAENSAGAVLEAVAPLLEAAGTGLAVLIVVHQRKSGGEHGDAIRGSTVFVGSADIVVELERPAAHALATDGARVLRAVSRFASTPEDAVVQLDGSTYRALGASLAVRQNSELEQVRDALAASGEDGATAGEIAKNAALPETTARRRLDTLAESGQATRVGAGGPKEPHRWRLLHHPEPVLEEGDSREAGATHGIAAEAPERGSPAWLAVASRDELDELMAEELGGREETSRA
jgi:hypothetical protein